MSNGKLFRRVGLPVLALAAASQAHGLDAAAPEVRHERIRISTGVTLHVAETGPADGRPVLFLHGYSDSWFSWTPILDRLPADVRAILLTARGHGDSERPACCYTRADFAADAVATLDALGIERATVVGHSMGSFVAQRMAIDHPDRIDRLVLVGSGATYGVEAVLGLTEFVRTMTDPVDSTFVREFQVSTIFHPVPSHFLERVVAESRKLTAHVWSETATGMLIGDGRSEGRGIAAPTLTIWGERDAIFDRAQQDGLVKSIPDSRLVIYEQTGHAVHWERPDRFAADLTRFLDGR